MKKKPSAISRADRKRRIEEQTAIQEARLREAKSLVSTYAARKSGYEETIVNMQAKLVALEAAYASAPSAIIAAEEQLKKLRGANALLEKEAQLAKLLEEIKVLTR